MRNSWRQSPGLQQRQLLKSNINWPSMSTAGCRHSAVQFDMMLYALLQWLKQTTNRVLTHKRYPISHPHGRAMWCPLWGFGENWPPCNSSTLHYDLDDGRSHYHQGNKMFALESLSLHAVGTDRLHKDGWKTKAINWSNWHKALHTACGLTLISPGIHTCVSKGI